MAINTSLLVADSTLQDYLVDKDTGLPLVNGVITFYQDNSRTTLKNVYYQAGVAGSYTYIPFSNPIILSAVGTVVDNNGNDTKIFYYPYSEVDNVTPQPYYVTVDSQLGERQFTRQDWPPAQNGGNAPSTNSTILQNLITNNVFWRNIGSINATNLTATTLAPSQHDGFSMPDIQFMKSTTGATDTITFNRFVAPSTTTMPTFADQILPNDVTPEFYLNLNCTGAGSETSKYIQIPISLHIASLSGAKCTVAIDMMNVSGNVNNVVTLSILQYLGTGAAANPPVTIQSIVVGSSWTKTVIAFTMPSAQNLIVGGGSDDALYLQINFPTAVTCNINIAKPAIYIGSAAPTNDYQTYDQANAIFNSPRTGDVRTSLNSFVPFGWVAMDDGTIGNATSGSISRSNADTFQLFSLIWNAMQANQTYAPMYTSSGVLTSYGATPIADFNASNTIALTKSLGQVLAGTIQPLDLIPTGIPFTVNHSVSTSILTMANVTRFSTGTPVRVKVSSMSGSLPTGLNVNQTYYTVYVSGTTLTLTNTIADALNNTNLVTFSDDGSGTFAITTFSNILGAFTGDDTSTIAIANMSSHNHPGSVANTFSSTLGGSGTGTYQTSGTPTTIPLTVASQGGGTPLSIVQPTTYMNMFIKL